MALVLNDRVKETTTTAGTGTINLAGAATNFETFVAGIGNGNTVYYAIVHQDQAEFEVGLGTVTDATPDTLSRTTVLSSSNSDGLVSFSAGTKDVFCTLPASKTVFEDASGDVVVDPNSLILLGDDNDVLLESKNTSASSASQFKISHNLGSDVIQSQRGDLTLDVAGDIVLDADGGDLAFNDGGTTIGTFAFPSFKVKTLNAALSICALDISLVSFPASVSSTSFVVDNIPRESKHIKSGLRISTSCCIYLSNTFNA